ncbi:Putative ribonuclease H protein At1g65750 [Linum perenne]
MSAACQHSIHNGKDTMFWMARWLDSDIRLVEHAAVSLTDEDLAMSVAKATNEDGNWNWELLCNLLPRNIVYFIAGMEPPGRDTREDEMIWGPDPRRNFTLKSAYEILDAGTVDPDAPIWTTVWRILINAERARRNMSAVAECARCPGLREDRMHVLRDYRIAKLVWQGFIQPTDSSSFFSDNLHTWLLKGLKQQEFGLTFGIVIWILWKA